MSSSRNPQLTKTYFAGKLGDTVKRVIWVSCLAFLISLALTVSQTRAACSPPYPIQYSVNGTTITYSVTGIAGTEQSWTIPQSDPNGVPAQFIDYKCAGGILAWVAVYTKTGESDNTYEIHYVVYDPNYPNKPGWVHQCDTFDAGKDRKCYSTNGNTTWFNVKDGVVTYLTENVLTLPNSATSANMHYLNFCTYDPQLHKWQLEKWNFDWEYGATYGAHWLTVKDGVVLWAVGGNVSNFDLWGFLTDFFAIVQDAASFVCPAWTAVAVLTDIAVLESVVQDAQPMVSDLSCNGQKQEVTKIYTPATAVQTIYYSIYDPGLEKWVTNAYQAPSGYIFPSPEDANGSLVIKDATVYITSEYWDSVNIKYVYKTAEKGYVNGKWTEGVATQPVAYFAAQPGGGQIPVEVGFWNMSIGSDASARQWTFSDGTSTSQWSPIHTFSQVSSTGEDWANLFFANQSECRRDLSIYNTPPSGSICINLGGQYTNSPNVTLTGTYSETTTEMCLGCSSGGGSVHFGLWTAAPHPLGGVNVFVKSYQLPTGDGLKTVYVKYLDSNTGDVITYSASITLDTTPPTGHVSINGGDSVTYSRTVNLYVDCPDADATEMAVCDDGNIPLPPPYGTGPNWQPFTNNLAYTFSTPDNGTRTVYVVLKDAAGNICFPFTTSIGLDTTDVPQAQMSINIDGRNNGFYSNHYLTGRVHFLIHASIPQAAGPLLMRLGFPERSKLGSSTINWGQWMLYATIYPPISDNSYSMGTSTSVGVEFLDTQGTTYGPVEAYYIVDSVPPTDGTLSASMLETQAYLSWSDATDDKSGLKTYELYYSPDGIPDYTTGTLIYEGLATKFTQTDLPPGKNCYYRLYAIDNAGNVSTGATLQAKTRPIRRALPFLNLLLHD